MVSKANEYINPRTEGENIRWPRIALTLENGTDRRTDIRL